MSKKTHWSDIHACRDYKRTKYNIYILYNKIYIQKRREAKGRKQVGTKFMKKVIMSCQKI